MVNENQPEAKMEDSGVKPSPSSPFRFFVSYAHASDDIKTRLMIYLAPLVGNGLIELWEDGAIPVGASWRQEIGAAMDWADGAIFLVCGDFLASEFCNAVEVPTFLKRYQDDHQVLLAFVLVEECLWEEKPFIEEIQLLPPKGKPIRKHRDRSEAYTAIARALAKRVKQLGGCRRLRPVLPIMPKAVSSTLELSSLLAKLPGRTSQLFGRETELSQITAWRDHKGVFLWVADGGTGKSSLVRWWLEQQQGWPTGTRFIGHSFYSQGSRNQAISSRGFLLAALAELTIPHTQDASDDELGRLLAQAVGQRPTVLVLDGIEPLQQASKDNKLNGTVKDRGLATLLEGVACGPGHCLCLVSSRLPIPDIGIKDAPYFRKRRLDLLPPDGAHQLLDSRGVLGTKDELDVVAERCGHHPLALVLAAEFCHTYLRDQASTFLARPWHPTIGETHAATVMAWFDSALAAEHQPLDRELVRILGLFDRPAPWGALLALQGVEPPIPGLTQALHQAQEPALLESLARLSQWGLIQADMDHAQPELDAHPLVREHFGPLLEQEAPEAFRAGHDALFTWFCRLPAKDLPDTLAELEPLYRSVGHGCHAGRYCTTLDKIYWRRIRRGQQGYSLFQVGGYSSDLAALTGFFPHGWDQPPVAATAGQKGEALSEADRSWLLADAAFCLMTLGRLEESLGPRRIGWQREEESGDWRNFCTSCGGLADLLTFLGRWTEAEAVSRKGVEAAARIEDKEQRWQRRIGALSRLGRTLHCQGRLAEAVAAFRKAEAVQAQIRLHEPWLYSLLGYDYAQLLLEQSGQATGWQEVLARGQASLRIAERLRHLISQALDHCTIAQASAALGTPEAMPALDRAAATMQCAGSILQLPAMHLARATFLRTRPDLPAAWADHDAALAIARRGNMRTYLAECALLAGNLYLDEESDPLEEAAAQHATAARLIREDGYGRRLTELHLLQARLLHAQHDPEAPQALARAEARIREVGQWFFWRELRAVARELGSPDPGDLPPLPNRSSKTKPSKKVKNPNNRRKHR